MIETLARTDPERSSEPGSKRRARFLSALVHEVRTPLASSCTLIELLAALPEVRAAEKEKLYVDGLRQVMRDVQLLLDDVAELARLLGGRIELKPGDVSPAALVAEVEDALRPQAWERGVSLSHSLGSTLPPLVRAGAERLRQLLALLLGATVGHARSAVLSRLDAESGRWRAVLSSTAPLPGACGRLRALRRKVPLERPVQPAPAGAAARRRARARRRTALA